MNQTLFPKRRVGGGQSRTETLTYQAIERLRTMRTCEQLNDDVLRAIMEDVEVVHAQVMKSEIDSAYMRGENDGFDQGSSNLEDVTEERDDLAKIVEIVRAAVKETP